MLVYQSVNLHVGHCSLEEDARGTFSGYTHLQTTKIRCENTSPSEMINDLGPIDGSPFGYHHLKVLELVLWKASLSLSLTGVCVFCALTWADPPFWTMPVTTSGCSAFPRAKINQPRRILGKGHKPKAITHWLLLITPPVKLICLAGKTTGWRCISY